MKKILISLISVYQKIASFLKYVLDRVGLVSGNNCVFFPTCSVYAKKAISKHGATIGSYLAIKRILRCHPWQKNHIDPVP